MNFLFAFLLSLISVFLILLILVQRGRGGGLTGALGGMGGQSAFFGPGKYGILPAMIGRTSRASAETRNASTISPSATRMGSRS